MLQQYFLADFDFFHILGKFESEVADLENKLSRINYEEGSAEK